MRSYFWNFESLIGKTIHDDETYATRRVPSLRCRAEDDGFRQGQSPFLPLPRRSNALGYRLSTRLSVALIFGTDRACPKTVWPNPNFSVDVGRVMRNNVRHVSPGPGGPSLYVRRCRVWVISAERVLTAPPVNCVRVHCPPSFPRGRVSHSYARNNKRRLYVRRVRLPCPTTTGRFPWPFLGRKDVRGRILTL